MFLTSDKNNVNWNIINWNKVKIIYPTQNLPQKAPIILSIKAFETTILQILISDISAVLIINPGVTKTKKKIKYINYFLGFSNYRVFFNKYIKQFMIEKSFYKSYFNGVFYIYDIKAIYDVLDRAFSKDQTS